MSRRAGRVVRVPVSACWGERARVFARSFRLAASRGWTCSPLTRVRPRSRPARCFRPHIITDLVRKAFRPAGNRGGAFSPGTFFSASQAVTDMRHCRVSTRTDILRVVFARTETRPVPRAGTRAQRAPSYRRETEQFCASFAAVAMGNLGHASLPVVHGQCTWRALFGTGPGSKHRLRRACVPPVHFL